MKSEKIVIRFKANSGKLVVCPRCGMQRMNAVKVMNALSRRDNKTYICSECGTREALFDFTISQSIKQERSWLTKKKGK